MNEAPTKPIRLRRVPVGAKVVLGIAYGLPWFFIAQPTWDNLYSQRPYHEGIPIRAALIFIILPFFIGGTSAFLDYIHGHSGRIAAVFSGWLSCFVGAFTSIFVGPHYSVAIIYILPILAAASVGSVIVNLWLRSRHPIDSDANGNA
jgi:hypothetical protein